MSLVFPIRIVLTDDHPMLLEGLQKVLSPISQIEIIGIYRNATELLNALEHNTPDVLMLDIQMPGLTGLEASRIIKEKFPHVQILIFSGIESHYYIIDLIQSGCNGYLMKSTTEQSELLEAITTVARGDLYLDPSIKQEILMEMLRSKRKKNAIPKLTEREKEVLQLIVEEYSNQEIAEKLKISSRTVENHRYNLIQKLDVKNTVGLVKTAMQLGLIK